MGTRGWNTVGSVSTHWYEKEIILLDHSFFLHWHLLCMQTGHALPKPWRRGGPRPWRIAIKEGPRLRWDFKDLLASISLLHSSWMLLVGSFPGVCNKAFPWRLIIQEIDYFTEFSKECACLRSKSKDCCWGRYWSPWSPALNGIGSRLLWPTSPK